MCKRPGTFRHQPNFMPTRPRRSTNPLSAAITPCGHSPPTQSLPLPNEAPHPKSSRRADPEGPRRGCVTGHCLASALVRAGLLATPPGAVVPATRGPVEGATVGDEVADVQAASISTTANITRTPKNLPRPSAATGLMQGTSSSAISVGRRLDPSPAVAHLRDLTGHRATSSADPRTDSGMRVRFGLDAIGF